MSVREKCDEKTRSATLIQTSTGSVASIPESPQGCRTFVGWSTPHGEDPLAAEKPRPSRAWTGHPQEWGWDLGWADRPSLLGGLGADTASASSWISIGLTAIEEGGYLSARFRPWNRLHFAGVQFLDAAGDFAAPLFFGGRIDFFIQAFEQRTSQGGTRLGRQRQSFFEKLRDVRSHGRILAPKNTIGPARAEPSEENRSVRHSVRFSMGEGQIRVKILEEMSLFSLLKLNFSLPLGRMDPAGFEPASATVTECRVPLKLRALEGVPGAAENMIGMLER
jgi:hypothetical protein